DELPGRLRSYQSFSEANEENGRSRVYLGIHWNFDDVRAREMGETIADAISQNHFQAIPEPPGKWLAGLMLLSLFGRRRRNLRQLDTKAR
ncbi:MAG: hypothetical protein AAF961_07675, partial [Planctomycetota bacterium]